MPVRTRIAWFSMEIAAEPDIPTYAGGLGVLAGDVLRACADLEVPVVAVSLLHRQGYFRQTLDRSGRQLEAPQPWDVGSRLELQVPAVSVPIGGRQVQLRAWRYDFIGLHGHRVPAFLLDAELEANAPADRRLTDLLYGGDDEYRLAQEIVLGVGGVRMLEALGYRGVLAYHLNEGHAALAPIELLRQQADRGGGWDPEPVRKRCVFTTHTPVPAGHDRFDWPLADRLLSPLAPREVLQRHGGTRELNLTLLALSLSHRVNGVAASHEHSSEHLFPGRDIRHVTNGVHSTSWTSAPFQALYDRYVPHWRQDPSVLRMAASIPRQEIWRAHLEAKGALLQQVRALAGRELAADRLTLGFARRSTGYKRPQLIFHDLDRLEREAGGRLQLIFAGKAHPKDEEGKALIAQLARFGTRLGEKLPVVFLADYDVKLARVLVAGCDVWLNTPLRPLEASGTSGMKAAHNGVPSLSILDGWWEEGCVEGVTGWAIGAEPAGQPLAEPEPEEADAADAASLYQKLFEVVLPLWAGPRERWIDVMRSSIALNASYFNAHRMVQQYLTTAWLDAVQR